MDTMLWAMTRRTIRRILLVGLLLGAAGLACAQEIVVTLLPKESGVWEYKDNVPSRGSADLLKVTDSDAKDNDANQLNKTVSWLDFPATALPGANAITIIKAQLVLAREYQKGVTGARGMAINVVPVDANDPGKFPALDVGVVGTIQSDPETRTEATLNTRDTTKDYFPDSASLIKPGVAEEGGVAARLTAGHVILLLEPTASASQRIYYGLNSPDPGLQPRLIVTYIYKTPPLVSGCTSEPAALASTQADGRLADSSSCAFIFPADNPTRENYFRLEVASATQTKTPAVYRDRLYVVRKRDGEFFLDALTPLGEPALGWEPLKLERTGNEGDPIVKGDSMVVDRFGRLRIVTPKAIFTCQLDANPLKIDKKAFVFGSDPKAVVPGPDGSLYVVAGSIFALNPDLLKLWQVSVDTSASTAITLGPDGHFVYALLKRGSKSQFLAINAQTGQNVAVSGFPDYLTAYRNPVVVHQAAGADYIAVAGESSGKGVLWIVRNLPKSPTADSLATLTKRWEYNASSGIGQPIPCSVKPDSKDLSTFGLCFVVAGGGEAKMASVPFDADSTAEPPTMPREEPLASATGIGDPVVDSAGNVILWANDTLYGYASPLRRSFAAKPAPLLPPDPQLLFGPGGTLYAVSDANNSVTVSALIPSFTLSISGPAKIFSPTSLQVTGTATAGQELGARGSVILGNGFVVKNGSALTVKVNASQ